jgi:hypothetical protein
MTPDTQEGIDEKGQMIDAGKTTVSGPTLEFTDCLFVFSIATEPPPSGRQFAKALLAQNGTKLDVPIQAMHD